MRTEAQKNLLLTYFRAIDADLRNKVNAVNASKAPLPVDPRLKELRDQLEFAQDITGATWSGGVLTLTLNRPERLNALNAALIEGLSTALKRAAEPDCRAVLITGAGRGFCAGADLANRAFAPGDIAHRHRVEAVCGKQLFRGAQDRLAHIGLAHGGFFAAGWVGHDLYKCTNYPVKSTNKAK